MCALEERRGRARAAEGKLREQRKEAYEKMRAMLADWLFSGGI